jgi:osmotically inducible protein OsmC
VSALYTAVARSTGDGRNGHVRTDDALLDLDVRTPRALGGPGGATNPEQLFAAGFAACFHSALKLVGRQDKLDVSDSEVGGEVSLTAAGGGYVLSVRLAVRVPSVDRATAQTLADKAHAVCPYSNATRGNIDVTVTVE